MSKKTDPIKPYNQGGHIILTQYYVPSRIFRPWDDPVYCIISICISKKEDHCEKAGNNVIKARAVGAGGAGGGHTPPPQILTDHLTLYKPGVSDYARHNTICPPRLSDIPPALKARPTLVAQYGQSQSE